MKQLLRFVMPPIDPLNIQNSDLIEPKAHERLGLTVDEAMWKSTPVIGGNVGGIRYQIEDGVNGFLVSSVEEAAERIVGIMEDRNLREEMGKRARETVREKFLLPRYVEQYLD